MATTSKTTLSIATISLPRAASMRPDPIKLGVSSIPILFGVRVLSLSSLECG